MKRIKNRKKGRLAAMTLMEIVMVLGIIAILFMLVLPNQSRTVAMAKSIEAKSMLNQVYSMQKNYFFMYSKYSMSLDEIGFEQERLATEGGQANYRIQITEASNGSFNAQAEAVVDFDADGTLNVWSIDQNKLLKEVVKD
ncbi:MAG: type II secretion system GspH family protein [Crocinitomicaceae bacterium]|nr:type II secretion system GspH family protein [Crocinitomicaceae bacterium]